MPTRFKYLPLDNLCIDFNDSNTSWDNIYEWCDDRFENKWNISSTNKGLQLVVHEECDLTEFKLTWL